MWWQRCMECRFKPTMTQVEMDLCTIKFDKIRSHVGKCDDEKMSDIILKTAGFLFRCTTFPIVWIAKTIYNNFLAVSVLGSSMGMVYLGSKKENYLYRFYYYLTAAALFGIHFFILRITYGPVIVPSDVVEL